MEIREKDNSGGKDNGRTLNIAACFGGSLTGTTIEGKSGDEETSRGSREHG